MPISHLFVFYRPIRRAIHLADADSHPLPHTDSKQRPQYLTQIYQIYPIGNLTDGALAKKSF